jgi:hypothetical protein
MKTRERQLRTIQRAYQTIMRDWRNDGDVRFITNVIMCHCSKRATKLHNLIKLLETGREVRRHQFDMFKFRIDGNVHIVDFLDDIG